MIVYLSSPKSQMQGHALKGMPVLLSYAMHCQSMDPYMITFERLLFDSGAFTAFRQGKPVDLSKYVDWVTPWMPHADAVAGLDDLSGDWRQSLRNYEAFPGGFPTYHIADPESLLSTLVDLCLSRKQWLGVGMCGPQKTHQRERERWLRWVLDQVPETLHVHGWALGRYTHLRRLDSIDTTRWLRIAQSLGSYEFLAHHTSAERTRIAAEYLQRRPRALVDCPEDPDLFDGGHGEDDEP